jgi:uncharacterized membrane-anchored protein
MQHVARRSPETPGQGDRQSVRPVFRLFTRQPLAAKVPEITALFWVIKIATTAAGEAISDALSTGNKGVGALVEIGVFVAALMAQFSTRRYFAPAYWFLALAIATAGTGVSDTMHLTFGIPYAVTSLLWAVVLAVVFYLWDRSEHTLSIHSITTSRREKFYWATIFATFALGTALGDFTATTLGLGYLASAIFFCVVILIPWIGWFRFRMNEIFAFWFAYVVTRPIGASFADYISKPKDTSGLGFGDVETAAVITLLVVILVAYTSLARFDIQSPDSDPDADADADADGDAGSEVAGGT